ncbi:MAG: aldo/keto reductase [Bryobacteraceae bacterium]
MTKSAAVGAGMPAVCRLGLATRGGSGLSALDVEWAIERGINYLNWCGHPDGLSAAIAGLGRARSRVVIAFQFQARTRDEAVREFDETLARLRTDRIDVATLYYVESEMDWGEIMAPGGVWDFLDQQKRSGRLGLIGLTGHQRKLAAKWAQTGRLDLLMVRYNAAHRGAERDIFPVTSARGMPVVTFTGLRWKALLNPTPDDPPEFRPVAASEYYRFCLANENVTVALTAPGNRRELEENLRLLDDWRLPSAEEFAAIRGHGDRVRRHSGAFW